jgi:hypothetical protein
MQIFNKTFILSISLCCNISFSQVIKKDSTNTKLDEVVIVSKNPISEKFSVIKVEKIDIYFNPMSNADPLKAITILPASTNTNETANPTLRGGDADRSRVFINGSPILNPVRNGQDNGLGNFSLFNTELIEKQYVYASNPPLTYGNTSAGIVDIETTKKLFQEGLQLSWALSNNGFLLNKKIGKKNFIQLYANHQYSDVFLDLNKTNLPNLHNFSTNDIGLNAHFYINEKASFNSYTYYINEQYESKNYRLNFSDDSKAKQKRLFSINNFDYLYQKSKFKISTLMDFSNQNYNYGVINSQSKYFQFFSSLSHKYQISNKNTLQYGIDYSISKYNYDEVRPLYYYSLDNYSPTYLNKEKNNFQYLESYIYFNYKLSNSFGFSSAIRKNIPLENQLNFISYQIASNYELDKNSRFILSLGNYHSYSTPNYISHNISLLSSFQFALDYYYTTKNFQYTSAIYYKKDSGNYMFSANENFDKIKSIGFEISSNYFITKRFSLGLSNSYINQKIESNNKEYNSTLNLKYFIKAQATYYNQKLFTTSLVYSRRPGDFYTKIENVNFNDNANNYEPTFGQLNSENYSNYSKLDFTINRAFQIKSNSLICYISINNILNTKNQATINYNQNYTEPLVNYYQRRIIYFGVQYRLNQLFQKNISKIM